MKTNKLTREQVERLAKLANLFIDRKEEDSYPEQLSESLKFVENLKEIDTSGVPETFFTTKEKNVMQEDEIDDDVVLPQAEVLKNASKTKNGYFIVKRIL